MLVPEPLNPFEKTKQLLTPPVPPAVPDHELIRRIGGGSYGDVWLARNVMGTYRAVKIIYRESFEDERPFQREFAGIHKFEPISRAHESQVDILHVGKSDGCFFYVMELADDQRTGQQINPDAYKPKTLRTELTAHGALPLDECLRIGIALATALDHLHQHGLVHRDIKPANIIFVNSIPKLADIGLVARTGDTLSFVGTEGYFPPEGPGTPQADLYSLGKVLYEMCTGLDRQDYPDLPTQLIEQQDREGLLELNAIIAKACKASSAERYQTAKELHSDLSSLQSGKPVRQIHLLERRLARLKKIGAAAFLVGGILAGAFLFQRHQTSVARKLAEENRHLAEANQKQLVRLQTAIGSRLMQQDDLNGAAVVYAQSLKSVQPGTVEEELQRLRLCWLLRNAAQIEQLFVHKQAINQAVFSPDGKLLLTASDDGTARIFDSLNGKPVSGPTEHGGRVLVADFNPEGSHVVTGGGNKAKIWNVRDGSPIGKPIEHRGTIIAASFNGKGKHVLTGSYDQTARVWDAATGEPVTEPLEHKRAVLFAIFSPDFNTILTGSQDNTAKLWDAKSGQLLLTLMHTNDVERGVFSSDGARIVTAGGQGNAWFQVWDARTGERILSSRRYKANGIGFATFSPDDQQIFLGSAPMLVFEATNSTARKSLNFGTLRCNAFSREGDYAASGSERAGLAYVWNWKDKNLKTVFPPLAHSGFVNSAAFSPDGARLLTGSDDGVARIWSLRAGNPVRTALKHESPVWSATFSTEPNRVITATPNGRVRIWNAATGELAMPPLVSSNAIGPAHFSRDRRWMLVAPGRAGYHSRPPASDVSTNLKSQILIRDTVTGAIRGRPIDHSTNVACAAISQDGAWAASATSDGIVRVWNTETGAFASQELKHSRSINFLSFSPNGALLAAASSKGSTTVWNWSGSNEEFPALKHRDAVNCVTFSHDGRLIATVSLDQTCTLWNAGTGQVAVSFKHGGNLQLVKFSPDDRLVVTAGLSPRVRIWDSSTGEQVIPALEHESAINDAVFHPTAPIILTCSEDATARLWDLITGEPLTPPLTHKRAVIAGDFAPDGRSFVTASADGTAQIWTFPESTATNEELTRLAYLLASQSPNRSGAILREKPDSLMGHLNAIREKLPIRFDRNQP